MRNGKGGSVLFVYVVERVIRVVFGVFSIGSVRGSLVLVYFIFVGIF